MWHCSGFGIVQDVTVGFVLSQDVVFSMIQHVPAWGFFQDLAFYSMWHSSGVLVFSLMWHFQDVGFFPDVAFPGCGMFQDIF